MTDLSNPRLFTATQQIERRERMKAILLREAEQILATTMGNEGPHSRMAHIYAHAVEQAAVHDNLHFLRGLAHLKRVPVGIDEFCDSQEFLGELQEIWPRLRPDIRRMNPDVFMGDEPVHEVLLGGATGTGKTTLSYTTNAYQLYLFSCFHKPQLLYGLSEITPIVFMMQSVSQTITKRIIYRPFRKMFLAMPYAQRWLTWDKRRESELVFDNGLTVVPALANLDAILGQAIAACMLDEVNFMRVIDNSKQVAGSRGKGGLYDQATEVHTNITRRRQRSFQTRGYSMGALCILSSTRYKNDFLDRRIDEVQKHAVPNVLPLRRKQYEVVPQDRFCGEKFGLVVGTDDYRTMVIEEGMEAGIDYPENARIEMIPVEYKHRFLSDPDGALRDIVGVATDTIAPFLGQRHKVVEAVTRNREAGYRPLCAKDYVELQKEGMPQWDEEAIEALKPAQRTAPRFIHIDLSLNNDACGVSVVRLAGFVNKPSPEDPSVMEIVPNYVVEAAVAIRPSAVRELDIEEVRRWAMQLSTFYGLDIYAITFDGYQSKESQQVLRKAGVRTWEVSMDRTMDPYNELKRSFYEDRIFMPHLEHLRMELSQLEYHSEQRKVDHPPKGSKDVADAVCGAIYAARSSRLVRTKVGTTDEQGDNKRVRDNSRRDPPRRN